MRRRHERARQRGAAMVEAVLVIAVMVVFLGLTMYTFHSYETKLDQQTATRSAALTEASHHCEGGGGTQEDSGFGLDGQGAGAASNLGGGATSAFFMSTVTKTGTATVNGSAVQDRERITMSRTINSYSETVCSPKPESWGDIFSSGLSGLRGIVGL